MSGQQAENTLHENAIGWIFILFIIGVGTYFFWMYFDSEVRNLVRWLRYGQMWLISHFVGDEFTVLYNGKPVNWEQGFRDAPLWSAERLTFKHLAYFNALAMQPLRPVFAALCGAAALWCLFRGPETQFRSSLDLEGLIKRQSKTFPYITPFIKLNPSKLTPRPPGSPVPAELPLFSEALGPEEWIAYNSIPVPNGNIDEDAAWKAFARQLGGRWKGPKALKPYQQILLASFALKAARKRAEADVMLGRLAKCWSGDKGLVLSRDKKLYKDALRILRNKKIAGGTLKMTNRHAFVTPALMRALAYAREEGGVLAPAMFTWLRGHDRRLWYPLNNMGRQSYHMEALGAMSHYRAEKMTQRPIPVPKMDDAIETIRDYMKSSRARPIPALDYSHSKKRGIKKAMN